MKKIVAVLLVLTLPLIWGCADNKTIDGKLYKKYGLINKDDIKDETIEYDLVVGNFIWSFILIETIIAPIYFFGFALYREISSQVPYPWIWILFIKLVQPVRKVFHI